MVKRKIWGVFCVIALVWSCNFVEEIHFNEDGSGMIDIHFDGNELMAMAASMDTTQQQEKAVDSTIVFRELLEDKKDSIAQLPPEEQAKLKKLEPFSMHMKVDPEKSIMKFNLFSEFENVADVNDAFNAFQDASSLTPTADAGAQTAPMGSQKQTTKVNYSFSGNRFKRSIEIIDEELFKKSMDSIKDAEMFLSGSTYTFKYHFPRKVKSTNVEGATFSLDGKTMTYEVDFLQMMKDPESILIEVELDD